MCVIDNGVVMNTAKTISRLVTLPIPFKNYRKNSRKKIEEILNLVLAPEKAKCLRDFKKEYIYNTNLPRDKFHIISLGTNCFVRMTLNLWELKPRKAEGEKTMPFDLSIHPLQSILDFLKNDFNGYFENVVFDEQNQFWVNPRYGIKFIHDKVNDRQLFEKRYKARIENFNSALSDNKPCLFICHVLGNPDVRLVNNLYETLKNKCTNKNFKLILAVFNGVLEDCDKNIKIYARNFPYENYLYMDKNVKFSQSGYEFEYNFMNCCRTELLNLLEG